MLLCMLVSVLSLPTCLIEILISVFLIPPECKQTIELDNKACMYTCNNCIFKCTKECEVKNWERDQLC